MHPDEIVRLPGRILVDTSVFSSGGKCNNFRNMLRLQGIKWLTIESLAQETAFINEWVNRIADYGICTVRRVLWELDRYRDGCNIDQLLHYQNILFERAQRTKSGRVSQLSNSVDGLRLSLSYVAGELETNMSRLDPRIFSNIPVYSKLIRKLIGKLDVTSPSSTDIDLLAGAVSLSHIEPINLLHRDMHISTMSEMLACHFANERAEGKPGLQNPVTIYDALEEEYGFEQRAIRIM